jgi:hypothetical protein
MTLRMTLRMTSREVTRLRVIDLVNIFESIRMHFMADKFDAVSRGFTRRIAEEKLVGRKDIFAFQKMAKRLQSVDNGIEFCVGNVIAGETWFPSFTEDNMLKYQKSIQSLGHNLQADCKKLAEQYNLDQCLQHQVGNYPIIVQKQLEGQVSFETVIVLQSLTNFLDHANKRITETLLWPDLYRRYKKYSTFVLFDKERIKQIVLDSFTNQEQDVIEEGIVMVPWKIPKVGSK